MLLIQDCEQENKKMSYRKQLNLFVVFVIPLNEEIVTGHEFLVPKKNKQIFCFSHPVNKKMFLCISETLINQNNKRL